MDTVFCFKPPVNDLNGILKTSLQLSKFVVRNQLFYEINFISFLKIITSAVFLKVLKVHNPSQIKSNQIFNQLSL